MSPLKKVFIHGFIGVKFGRFVYLSSIEPASVYGSNATSDKIVSLGQDSRALGSTLLLSLS